MSVGIGRQRLIDKIIEERWGKEGVKNKNYSKNELLFVIQEMLAEEGRGYLTKYSPKKGFANFKLFVEHLLYRNIANYDSMVLLTAEKGMGKSSAAIMLAREWCRMLGIKFDPNRHIAYNNGDLMRKIELLTKFEPIICDESVRFCSSEDWNKCISGDSLISTTNGLKRIDSLVGKTGFYVFSYNERTKQVEPKCAGKCVKVKKDIVYEVTLTNGQKIKTTKEHKVLTKEGWKKVEDITEDDYIATA